MAENPMDMNQRKTSVRIGTKEGRRSTEEERFVLTIIENRGLRNEPDGGNIDLFIGVDVC